MSFALEIESSIALSDTVESITTSQGRGKGKKSSPVWAHCRPAREDKDEDKDLLYCSYCIRYTPPDGIPPYGSNSSSAITKHINRHHPHVTIEKTLSKNQEAVKQQLR